MLRFVTPFVLLVLSAPHAFAKGAAPPAPPPVAKVKLEPLDDAEQKLATGHYAEVAPLLARVLPAQQAEAAGLHGELLRRTGKYAAARTELEAALQKFGRSALRVRRELGLIYSLTGARTEERAIWNGFYDDYEAGTLDKKSAMALRYVAESAQHLHSWSDANDTYRDALALDPKGRQGALTNLEWAALFLEKYDAAHAEVCVKELLEILPDNADAHALYAAIKLEQDYDVDAAEVEIAAALHTNPKQTDALALRAELALDADEFDEAIKRLAPVFAINPEHPRGRVLMAAAKLLVDDDAGYQAELKHALTTNPKDADFYFGLAEIIAKQHRYEDVSRLCEEALLLDPKHGGALAMLGANRLRLGQEKTGVEALQKAWSKDPFNVRTFNLLNLFEKVIPKDYQFIESKHFRLRVANNETVLAKYALPLLEMAFDDMVKRYGFTPPTPISVEVFVQADHYAVRTVGLPGLAALGVTFGPVITARSPSTAGFNWGMVLWHELGHVFSLGMSKNRVPRWFTEGLSEYETTRHDATWTRHTYAELARAVDDDELLPVEKLNHAFLRSRSIEQMVVAYHQSKEVITFIAERWGFDKILDLLRRFSKGEDTTRALTAATGLSLPEFDRQFRLWLTKSLAPYRGTLIITSSELSNLATVKQAVEDKRATPRQKALLALGYVKVKKIPEAQALLAELATSGSLGPEARLAEAEIMYRAKDYAKAQQLFTALAASPGGDGFEVRMRLGQIAVELKQPANALPQFERAKAIEPHRNEPYLESAKLFMAETPPRTDAAIAEYITAEKLDCMDVDLPKWLLKQRLSKKQFGDALAAADRALMINPFDVAAHLGRARALIGLDRKRDALAELDVVTKCNPTDLQKQEIKQVATDAGRVSL